MHKDLFAFLGLVVNLPLIAHSNKVNDPVALMWVITNCKDKGTPAPPLDPCHLSRQWNWGVSWRDFYEQFLKGIMNYGL